MLATSDTDSSRTATSCAIANSSGTEPVPRIWFSRPGPFTVGFLAPRRARRHANLTYPACVPSAFRTSGTGSLGCASFTGTAIIIGTRSPT